MARTTKSVKRPAKQSRSSATRTAIFEAGSHLFASKGFSATSVRDIAAAAGVNQALVFYYFGSKETLYDEILTEGVAHAARQIDSLTLEQGSDAPELMLVQAFADAFSSRPHLGQMILREHLDPHHFLDPAAMERLRGFMALTEKVLKSIPLSAEACRYDPQLIHLICVGPIIHFLVAQRVREAAAERMNPPLSTPSLDELVRTLSAMISAGLRSNN